MSKVRSLVILLLLVPMLAGCLGSEARSEWAYSITQIDEVNERGKHGAGVKIGVLDTGINVDHPSLDHLVNGDVSDGELRGFRDYIRDRSGVASAYDDDGHGTHVVGIMAARGSSFGDKILYGGIDLKGAVRQSSFYVAKVCDQEGCPNDSLLSALAWLRQEGVDVVSLSLGGLRNPLAFNDNVRNLINAMIDEGTVVVAAAGNDGANSSDVNAPADIEGVIAVGAIEEDGDVAALSNRGNNRGSNECRSAPLFGTPLGRCDPHKKPEVVAPGVGILSAWTEDAYVRADGTSQAAPFVTSVVALMLEGRPALNDRADVDRIKQILADTARPVDGQQRPHDERAGYGVVQALSAVRSYGGL